MENVDETKLQGDHSMERETRSVIGEKSVKESIDEPAPVRAPSEEPDKMSSADPVSMEEALAVEIKRVMDCVESQVLTEAQAVTLAIETLTSEVSRTTDRIESRKLYKGELAGLLMTVAAAFLGILAGFGIGGTMRFIVVFSEAMAVMLGILIIAMTSTSPFVTATYDAVEEFNNGRYPRTIEVVINSGMTLMNTSLKQDHSITILLSVQQLAGTLGFVLLVVGSI